MKNKTIKEFMQSDIFKNAVRDKLDLINLEREIDEKAKWFGTTGLPEDFEKEVSRYLRLEFGESLFDTNSLKADDLEFLGKFDSDEGEYYIWIIPTNSNESLYAYILYSEVYDGLFGMGGNELEKIM